jgi:small GTP-binding protein
MGPQGSRLLRPEYREAFEKDLRRLHAISGPWQVVFISGDLTLSGSKREFELVGSALTSLWSFFHSLGSRPRLLAVPGDHDVTSLAHNPLKDSKSTSPEEAVRGRLKGFTEWFSDWRRKEGESLFQPGLIPGDFKATTVSSEGYTVGVIGLNSVFRSGSVSPNRGWSNDLPQIEYSLGKEFPAWALRHDAVFLLTHQPPSLINAGLLDQLREKLAPPGRPFLHLCGSRFQDDWSDALELSPMQRAIQVPSLFSDSRTEPWRWGYAVGVLVKAPTGERLRFFPRIARSVAGGVFVGPLPKLGGDESHSFPMDGLRGTPVQSVRRKSREMPAVPSAPTLPQPPVPDLPNIPFRVLAQVPEHAPLPPGLRLHQVLGTEGQQLRKLAWTPSGDALAVGSANGQIAFWQYGESATRWSVLTSSPSILGLCFSPDGQILASSSAQSVRLWNRDGTPLHSVRFPGTVLAWSSQGLLAVDSGTGLLWLHKMETLADDAMKPACLDVAVVNCLAWAPDGRMLLRGGAEGDASLMVWSLEAGRSSQLMPVDIRQGPRCAILDAAWTPDSSCIALAGRDTNIHVWNPRSGRHPVAVLEGHTDAVTSVSFSHDGRLLASKSRDGTVRLWRTDRWEQVARIDEPHSNDPRAALAFSPTRPMLATLGPGNTEVRLWEFDSGMLLQSQAPSTTVHELSAKVVLVGEGRAGKSSLALRLVKERYEEMEATHGMRFWSLPGEPLVSKGTTTRPRREIILWDMGGQSEYQLVHQLFLRDSAVALMVMEPGRGERALEEVEGWNQRLLAQSGGRNIRKLLVGTKVDSELSPVDRPAIEALVKRCQLEAYLPTSAKTGQGVSELKVALAQAIDWSSIEKVSRPELFQRMRHHIQHLREAKRVVLTFLDLESELRQELGKDFEPEVLQAVVGQLARQGLVADSRMADGTRMLILEIEQVERYAGSIIVAARDNPHGVPAVDMAKVMAPSMKFPRIPPEERLRRDQELPVLDCVIELLIEHGLCLRHEGLLIFPSLFRPTEVGAGGADTSLASSLHYDFSGPIDNIYASLITSLAISRRFGPMRLWQDRAEFGRAGEDASGVRRVKQGSRAVQGHARLEVYFEPGTPSDTRELFVNFIEEHLAQRGVELLERLSVTCACGRSFAEDIVRDRLQRGGADIQCPVCDHRTPLALGARQARERNPQLLEQLQALRTDIRELRSQSIVATKVSMTEGKRVGSMQGPPLRILHLSDLHVSAEADPDSLFQALEADLVDSSEGLGVERLDYLVISGDITNQAAPQEFEKAHAFVSLLIERFGLTSERCMIVPGNHDLDWETEAYTRKKKRQVDAEQLKPGTFSKDGDGYYIRNDAKYPERFKNFSQHFYHPLTQRLYPLAPEEQCISSLFAEHRIQFLTMNSAWEIDEYFQGRSSISEQALARGLATAEQQKRSALTPQDSVLRVAIFHHPITGNEKIQDTAFTDRLMQAGVRVCLHGHVHEDRADLVNYLHPERGLHVVGAGSFGAPKHHRPESVPRLYNLLEIDRGLQHLRVQTRCLQKQGGAWTGWAVWPGEKRGEKREFYEVVLR